VANRSKERIEGAAAELMSRDGYRGTGLKAISDAAQLPYGSIYHHFPGGKEEIAATAISSMGTVIGLLLEGLFAEGLGRSTLQAMFEFMAERLEGSDWNDGCTIGTPALDGSSESRAVREASRQAFGQMIEPMAAALVRQGASRADALEVATTILAAYEGATMLARAQQSRAPLDLACRSMVRLVEATSGAS
jgi:TetR/AcrR family transcriptional repressor of lmrAB and yxaGH operons